MKPWEAYLDAHQDAFVSELQHFLTFASVSSLPQHREDVAAAARWLAGRMRNWGLKAVEVLPTDGHPVVYGEWLEAENMPTVLIYGHYDVQPVDPLDRWDHPPFEPFVADGRIYARGASDDKGNLMAPLVAMASLLETNGRLPLNVKCLFEGEEEIGSPHLGRFIENNRSRLACDLVLSADGGQWSEDQPSIMAGLRGICGCQIDISGPASDLHSGHYGGAVQNPIHALVRLVTSLHHADGRVAVDGFYNHVRTQTETEKALMAQLPFDLKRYQTELGVDSLFGEPGYTPLERTGVRPTLEINGIWGGFSGTGMKTVIPSEAHAKLTCRLVPDQHPRTILKHIRTHIDRHLPLGVRLHYAFIENGAKPYRIPIDHPGNRAAAEVLETLYGRKPFYVWEGGSIPVTSLFLEILKVYTVGFSFGLSDERYHAPNEFFRLHSFDRAQKAYARLLCRLADGFGP